MFLLCVCLWVFFVNTSARAVYIQCIISTSVFIVCVLVGGVFFNNTSARTVYILVG